MLARLIPFFIAVLLMASPGRALAQSAPISSCRPFVRSFD